MAAASSEQLQEEAEGKVGHTEPVPSSELPLPLPGLSQDFEALTLRVTTAEQSLTYHSDGDDDLDDDLDDELDDPIGDVLDWVEERPGRSSSTVATSSFSHRPNAHGGALNKSRVISKSSGVGSCRSSQFLPATKSNMTRLEAHFNGGRVKINFTDEHVDALSTKNVSQGGVGEAEYEGSGGSGHGGAGVGSEDEDGAVQDVESGCI